jgi:tRNA nucleotidyltransferase (CCA-adding enzyme)
MMASTKRENVKRSISNYFTRLRHIDISIKGRDLIDMGLEPGPIFRKILQAVHDAKINGQLKTRQDEFTFVKEYVR